MHLIQQLLIIFYVIFTHGFTLQDPSPLYDCLSNCLNDTCVDACNDFPDEDVRPQVIERTQANISLHCVGENILMIKFNPGIYIIEQRLSNSVWRFAKVTKGNVATFTNLTAGAQYRYRFHEFASNSILQPEVSDWFRTHEADYEPLPVKGIRLLHQTADETSGNALTAEFAFEPAEDRSCSYNILAWNGEHKLWNFHLKQMTEFRFELKYLEFNQQNKLSISSINSYGNITSPKTHITYYTPSCLEYYGQNLTICAPESVTGLQAKHTYHDGNLYDLQVYWDKPLQEPDNYTLEIDLHGDDDQVYVLYVLGNRTEVIIPNLDLGPQYIVRIAADSLGGTSLPEIIVKNLDTKHATTINKSYRELIIGIAMSVTIVVLVGMSCLQYCKQKSKKISMECTRFENFNQKDQSIENTKKLLPNNYDFDINNISSLTSKHDKFELSPKLLTVKEILGSGAYGVVRLGSLQDKFNNITDVAVKMLKEHPSMEEVQNFHKEILIMKFVGQHPNIVSLIGYCNLYDKPVLVVEYCCKGDLQTYLRTIWQIKVNVAYNRRARFKFDADSFVVNSNNPDGRKPNFQSMHIIMNHLYDIQQDVPQHIEIVTTNDLLNFARQIAMGMEFLSLNKIVHRDLAARNILVCADRIVKISDFGLSRDVYQDNLYKKEGSSMLPLKWMAIEALTHQIYSTRSDVWSFGVLLWEIATMGGIPYPGTTANALLKLLTSGYRMERPSSCSVEFYNIMLACWDVRPQSRPTFTQLQESLDALLSYHSNNKYLNMDKMLCESQEQYHEFDK